MQESTAIPHSWQELIRLAAAIVLTYGSTYLPALFKRKQSEADVHKTEAETRQIDLSTTLHAGDMLLKLMEQVAKATSDAERLRAKAEFWQAKAEAETLARELAERQLDERIRIGKPRTD